MALADAEPVRLRALGVFATPDEVNAILSLSETNPSQVAAAMNSAARLHGLPDTPEGYGLNVQSREFIGLAHQE
jgi:hypothetical protein